MKCKIKCNRFRLTGNYHELTGNEIKQSKFHQSFESELFYPRHRCSAMALPNHEAAEDDVVAVTEDMGVPKWMQAW